MVQGEWEWDSTQEFIIERLIGRMVADARREVGSPRAGRPRGGHSALPSAVGGLARERSLLRGRMRRTSPAARLTLWRSLMQRTRPHRGCRSGRGGV